jgi:hypothetical protein
MAEYLELVRKEIYAYFSQASVHGFFYFCAKISKLERIFWILITFAMFFIASSLVENTFLNWRNNPTIIVPAGNNVPISQIQFPTVTICPDFTPNRWGFLRNLLNLLKFQCNSDKECQETKGIRNYLSTNEGPFPVSLAEYPLSIMVNVDWDSISDAEKTEVLSPEFPNIFRPYMQALADAASMESFTHLMTGKFHGKLNNYGVYRDLNMDVDVPYLTHLNNSEHSEPDSFGSSSLLIWLNRMLALPSIGSAGTLLSIPDYLPPPDGPGTVLTIIDIQWTSKQSHAHFR